MQIKIPEFSEGVKDNVQKIGILIVAVACLFASGYWFGARNTASGDGDTIERLRSELRLVGERQSEVTQRLTTIEDGLANSAAEIGAIRTEIGGVREEINGARNEIGDAREAISNVTRRVDESEASLDRSADLISQCKQIVRDIRATGASQN